MLLEDAPLEDPGPLAEAAAREALHGDGDGPLRDAWLHNVRQLIAQQRGRRLDDVAVQVLSVRDEDDHTANPLAGRRTY